MNLNKKISLAIAAGAFALAPSLANAFTGTLIECVNGPNSSATATIKPGLNCQNTKNTMTVKTTGGSIGGCSDQLGVNDAYWDNWKKGGTGNTLKTADAPSINKADVTIKAKAYGSCNFGGGADSAKAWGSGTIKFLDAGGAAVPGGTSKFSARIAGDIATTSAQMIGIVTGGPGAGGSVFIQVPLDIPSLLTSPLLGCNTNPAFCSPDPFGKGAGGGTGCTAAGTPYPCCTGKNTGTCLAPVTLLPLVLGNPGFSRISFDDNALCTAPQNPFHCCTGAGTGTCD
jgi:hypothetical protein